MKIVKNRPEKIKDGLPNGTLTSHKMHCLSSTFHFNFGFVRVGSLMPLKTTLQAAFSANSSTISMLIIIKSNNVSYLTNLDSNWYELFFSPSRSFLRWQGSRKAIPGFGYICNENLVIVITIVRHLGIQPWMSLQPKRPPSYRQPLWHSSAGSMVHVAWRSRANRISSEPFAHSIPAFLEGTVLFP